MTARGWIIGATIAGTGLLGMGSAAQPARGADGRQEPTPEPVVVELFTAQGCAGCPEANQAVEAVAERPGVIALTYAVDYWDYLGWADTFARPEFAQRQRAYRQALRLRAVATPQVIVDGRVQLSGARVPALEQTVETEAQVRSFPPQIEFRETGDRVGVGSGRPPVGGAEVWAVVYRPGAQTVAVEGGDNRGRSVRHMNVVRRLAKLGDWTGRPGLYVLPADLAPEDAVAVLVQAKADRRILSAATQ